MEPVSFFAKKDKGESRNQLLKNIKTPALFIWEI